MHTVNEKIQLGDGAIPIAAAHVGAGIHSTIGSIELGANARVEGRIHMEKDGSRMSSESAAQVVLAAGTLVTDAQVRSSREPLCE